MLMCGIHVYFCKYRVLRVTSSSSAHASHFRTVESVHWSLMVVTVNYNVSNHAKRKSYLINKIWIQHEDLHCESSLSFTPPQSRSLSMSQSVFSTTTQSCRINNSTDTTMSSTSKILVSLPPSGSNMLQHAKTLHLQNSDAERTLTYVHSLVRDYGGEMGSVPKCYSRVSCTIKY